MAVTQSAFERRFQEKLDNEGFEYNKKDVQEVLDILGATIEECLTEDMKAARKLGWAKKVKKGQTPAKVKNPVVIVRGVGRFTVRYFGARTGRNPQTGESIKIAPSQRMRVAPPRSLKQNLGVK